MSNAHGYVGQHVGQLLGPCRSELSSLAAAGRATGNSRARYIGHGHHMSVVLLSRLERARSRCESMLDHFLGLLEDEIP
jgi:hypothetical protein